MFRDNVDGQVLHFDLFGLNGSNFVMRDRQTHSEWQQATGEAIAGPLKGKRLEVVPFVITTWDEWRAKYPKTLAMIPDPAFKDQYQRFGGGGGAFPGGRGAAPPGVFDRPPTRVVTGEWSGAAHPEQWGLKDDPRLPLRERVMGISVDGGQKAYPLALLKGVAALNDHVGQTPVVLLHSAATDTTMVFSRRLGDRTLTFSASKSAAAEVAVDSETGSQWDLFGDCIGGRLKGQRLEAIVPEPSFWFAWAGFYPNTEVYSAPEASGR